MFELVTANGASAAGNVQENIIRAVAEIEAACFSMPLTREQISRMLLDEQICWILLWEKDEASPADGVGHAPSSGEAELAGYVWAQTVLDEGYIGNVAVRPASRRRSGGDLLLEALDSLAKEKHLAFLTLEVRAGNAPAIALYEKHGYRRTGLRPGYYSAPREDALLMTKEFS